MVFEVHKWDLVVKCNIGIFPYCHHCPDSALVWNKWYI